MSKRRRKPAVDPETLRDAALAQGGYKCSKCGRDLLKEGLVRGFNKKLMHRRLSPGKYQSGLAGTYLCGPVYRDR